MIAELGERPAGVDILRNEPLSRIEVWLLGECVAWFTDRQQLEGLEGVLDWRVLGPAIFLVEGSRQERQHLTAGKLLGDGSCQADPRCADFPR